MEKLTVMDDVMAAEGADAPHTDHYSSESLLAPDSIDDHCSQNSGMDASDRLTFLEQRVQMQEDEIQLLKMTMADVLKRLNISEEQTAALTKRGAAHAARPASLIFTSRAATSTSSSSSLRKSSAPSSSPSSRNYSPAQASRRTPAGNVKDSLSTSVSSKDQTTAPTTTCKKTLETKPKETSSGVTGTRRVTQCKVTMQIYLSPLSRKTGRADVAAGATNLQPSVCPPGRGPLTAKPVTEQNKVDGKSPTLSVLFRKSPCESPLSPLNTPRYKSPIKSPSQYFQICY